ncbi:cold shock domain-containing protein [Nostoc sp. CHAB 5836]|nr:cold shock domain-containing protein [Nostoc sp. CHAB 5836]MCC5615692.1 cold shock domain-containing protein [Nostoc sp. CHAB 5836]
MKPALHKGQLIRWKDDRGFGFIQPDDSSQEVFLHITAFNELMIN